jgi:hypothetical protein
LRSAECSPEELASAALNLVKVAIQWENYRTKRAESPRERG